MKALARTLPHATARPIGRITSLLRRSSRARKAFLSHRLSHAFPEASPGARKRWVRQALAQEGAITRDAVSASRWSRVELCSRLHLEGWQSFHAIQGPMLLASARLGCWEVACVAIGVYRRPLSWLRPAATDRQLEARLSRFGNRLIEPDDAERELDRGGLLGVLLDDGGPDEKAATTLFGQAWQAPAIVAEVAFERALPVVPVFAWPLERGRYQLVARPAIDPRQTDDGTAFAQRCLAALEPEIRQRPDLWFPRPLPATV